MPPTKELIAKAEIIPIFSKLKAVINQWLSAHWISNDITQVFLYRLFGTSMLNKLHEDLKKIVDNCSDFKIIPEIIKWIEEFYQLNYLQNRLHYQESQRQKPINKSNNQRIAQIEYSWKNKEALIHYCSRYHKIWQFDFRNILVTFCLRVNEPPSAGKFAPKKYYVPSETPPQLFESHLKTHLVFWFDFRSLTPEEKKRFQRLPQGKIAKNFTNQLNEFLQKELRNLEEISTEREQFIQTMLENFLKFYTQHSPFLEIFPQVQKNLENAANNFIERKNLEWIKSINAIKSINENDNLERRNRQRLSKIELFNSIIFRVIDDITRLESLKLLFFQKPKLQLNPDYLISYNSIISTQNLQSDTLNELFFQQNLLNNKIKEKKGINLQNLRLIDTKYISMIEKRKIEKIMWENNLYETNLCIKSENWQGLNTLLLDSALKFDVTYIDPPYNTGNQDMIYQDRFLRGHWLTFLRNRLIQARELLSTQGVFFSSIDDNELIPFSLMFNEIFPFTMDNIIWHKKTQPSYLSKELITVTEYILAGKKTEEPISLMGSLGNPKKLTELINIGNNISTRIIPHENVIIANGWSGSLSPGTYGRGKLQITLHNGPILVKNGQITQDLILEGRFKWNQERIDAELKKGGIIHIKSIESLRPTIARQYDRPIIKAPTTLLSKKVNHMPTNTDANRELKDLFGVSPFDYSKPTELIKFLTKSVTYDRPNGKVLDFFAGSGTTAQAVMELNAEDEGSRKFVLIEQGRWFDSVLIPRLKRIMFSSNWKAGIPTETNGFSEIVRYCELEQYIDVWLNLDPAPIPNLDSITGKKPKDPYHLSYKLELDSNQWKITLQNHSIISPFGYWMYAMENGVIKVKEVDLIQSVINFLGLHNLKIKALNFDLKEYIIITGNSVKTPLNNKSKPDGKNKNEILIVWQQFDEEWQQVERDSLYWNDERWRALSKEEITLNISDFSYIITNGVKIQTDAVLVKDVIESYMNL